MSASLYWRPYRPNLDGDTLGWELKRPLVRRYWPSQDGSTNTEWVVLDDTDRPWLEGVRDGGGSAKDDANELLQLLTEFGKVEVRVWNG